MTSPTRTVRATGLRYAPKSYAVYQTIAGHDKSRFMTLTDLLRRRTASFLERIGTALYQRGIDPDWITLAGLALVGVGAVFVAQGQMATGGLLLLLALPLDALDGAVARAMPQRSAFGGIFDSTLDRYADGFIFAALGYYFASLGELDRLVLALAALVGSYGVSYVRARAGEAGIAVRVGLLTRLERVAVLLVMLFVPALLVPGLWFLALGTNATAIQRIWHVYRTIKKGNT
jgi:CDP-diacylglycerol---glycerol-3-phosphate 3-phosphatidyltransferase